MTWTHLSCFFVGGRQGVTEVGGPLMVLVRAGGLRVDWGTSPIFGYGRGVSEEIEGTSHTFGQGMGAPGH